MKNSITLRKRTFAHLIAYSFVLSLLLSTVSHAQQILSTVPDASTNTPVANAPAESEADLLEEARQAYTKGLWDLAIDKANQVIACDAQSKEAHMLRGSIYVGRKELDKAEYDYLVVLTIDPDFSAAKFDVAELDFLRKKYDEARTGFVELKNDQEYGDFATYKALLCDLFAGHEDAAAKDLDDLNQAGENPSYYFGNAAWDLVHHKPSDAADWLGSASRIYANTPQKMANYTRSLISLGYLPLAGTSNR